MSTVTIERATNGYVVTTDDGIRSVFAEPEELGAPCPEATAARNMLWYVNEVIGEPGSRHDEWRVSISLEPGDKWISPDEHRELLAGE